MDRNRLSGFGFVVIGLSELGMILTAGGVEKIGVVKLLMVVGGLALTSIGIWLIYRGDATEIRSESPRRTWAILALAAVAFFIGVLYALVG